MPSAGGSEVGKSIAARQKEQDCRHSDVTEIAGYTSHRLSRTRLQEPQAASWQVSGERTAGCRTGRFLTERTARPSVITCWQI